RRSMSDRMSRRPTPDLGHHPLTHLVREQLGVLHAYRRRPAYVVDDHDAHRHRTGEGATTDLIHTGEQAVAFALQRPLDPQRGSVRCGVRSHLAAAGTFANVSPGLASQAQCCMGHTTERARPTIRLSGTEPLAPPDLSSWGRESAELERWSPITQTRPEGTVMSKGSWLGVSPAKRYGSVSGAPLTVSLWLRSQQTTWSPGSPMTRLIRWLPSSVGSSPTKVNALFSAPASGLRSTGTVCGSQWSGSAKTTMSPRLRAMGGGVSLLTTTAHPLSRVLSIDSEGMKNACISQVLTISDN